jgi:uncharacterized protein
MKIGILSDTHTKVTMAKDALELLIGDGAEFIVHAGDIVEVDTLNLFKKCGLRYIAVYGNNDAHLAQYHGKYNLVQEPHYFKISDTKFKLMHMPYYMAPDTDVVIFGHTHEFESDFKNGTLFLNPGEACARNKPVSECVMLDVTETAFEVTYYTREKKETTFKHQKFSYERIKS